MSENIIPEEIIKDSADVENQVADTVPAEEAPVAEPAQTEPQPEAPADQPEETLADKVEAVADKVADKAADVADKVENFADKSLAELSDMFEQLKSSAERMTRSKEAESIKSAFYKLLGRLKGESGVSDDAESSQNNPFEAVEQNFKAMYADYKKERAEYNKEQDARREENLAKKQAIIEELKALVEGQEDVSAQFPAFRELQNRWREAGPVPATAFRDVNDTYQFYVEKFYDMVKINRDLRDLDFRKNLEAKEAFCEAAEKLAENDNVVNAFHELQKLHEQWKEFGPVAKEKREDIWNRFKAATAVINKRYQAHFEGLKEQQADNLVKKTELCERTEEVAAREITNTAGWNAASKEIEEIQAAWRRIGYATKKDNQKIYDRFRAACDKFFERKRASFSEFKDSMNENLAKKMAIIEEAESLKDSTDWKATSDRFIELQKQWKEIGAVPRKKSEQIWKRFRAACDAFFTARDNRPDGPGSLSTNLAAKKALIEAIKAYAPADAEADAAAAKDFTAKWNEIGFVPFKEKDKIQAEFREAMQAKFPDFGGRRHERGGARGAERRPLTEKDKLKEQFNALQQEIQTYENNIGFFGLSKGAEKLKAQMQERIDAAKAKLEDLKAQIRAKEQEEAQE